MSRLIKESNVYNNLYEWISSLQIIDCHEHLPATEDKIDRSMDFLMASMHYVKEDLISSGMNPETLYEMVVRNKAVGILDKWKLIEPYWNLCRNTGYLKAVRKSAGILFGADDISADNIEELDKKFREYMAGDCYNDMLKKRCKIKKAIRNAVSEQNDEGTGDPEYFIDSYPLLKYIAPKSTGELQTIFSMVNNEITGFEDYLAAVKIDLEEKIQKGAYIFKLASAYIGPIDLGTYDKNTARMQFEKEIRRIRVFMHEIPIPAAFDNLKEFNDYMTHFVLRILNQHSCVLQVHTGIQAGNGNILKNTNATLLSDAFMTYRNIKFDIFHISYPYQNELVAMAKMFPNVFVNFAWTHIISPNASVETLLECYDTLPVNKILGFGGDYLYVSNLIGNLTIARENIAKSLAIAVEDDRFDILEAKSIAFKILYDNPAQLYRI